MLNTELIYRSPLRDVIDDGKPLELDSKEKFGLASQLATLEEELTKMVKVLQGLLDKVKSNDVRIDDILTQIAATERQIALLKEQQEITKLALKKADENMTQMETKIGSLEKKVVDLQALADSFWAQIQGLKGEAQRAWDYARQADAAARPSGLIGGLLSLLPGLGHR